uniref:Uncharacterized protein n=1 Tax=Arundo donax TaxID=35708 RepID=A0A0A8YYF0_ARUDO
MRTLLFSFRSFLFFVISLAIFGSAWEVLGQANVLSPILIQGSHEGCLLLGCLR